jgi:hypothetical protein
MKEEARGRVSMRGLATSCGRKLGDVRCVSTLETGLSACGRSTALVPLPLFGRALREDPANITGFARLFGDSGCADLCKGHRSVAGLRCWLVGWIVYPRGSCSMEDSWQPVQVLSAT